MKHFPCSKCGVCCSMIGNTIKQSKPGDSKYKELQEFPHKVNKDGSCSQLNEDHTCNVHDNRPDICSIEKTWENHHQGVTAEEYHEMSIKACNYLMDQAGGVEEKFRIPDPSTKSQEEIEEIWNRLTKQNNEG